MYIPPIDGLAELAETLGCSELEALQRAVGTELAIRSELNKDSYILAVRPNGEKIRFDFMPVLSNGGGNHD